MVGPKGCIIIRRFLAFSMKRCRQDGRSSESSSCLRQPAAKGPRPSESASSGSEASVLRPAQIRAASSGADASAASSLRQRRAVLPSAGSEPECAPSCENHAGSDSSASSIRVSQRGLCTSYRIKADVVTTHMDVFPLDVDQRFYWALTARNSVGKRWEVMFERGLKEPWDLASGASALGAEFHAVSAVGIPLKGEALACEPDADARRILLANKLKEFAHVWNDFEAHIQMKGRCHRHGRFCDASAEFICPILKAVYPSKRKHCYVIGPPCQPFSTLSAQNRRRGAQEHPLFGTIFPPGLTLQGLDGGKSALDLLKVHLPLVAMFEEVLSFGQVDDISGIVWLREFLKIARDIEDPFTGQKYFTALDVWTEVPGKWLDVKRPRFARLN